MVWRFGPSKEEEWGWGWGGDTGGDPVTLDLAGSMFTDDIPVTIGNNLGANNNDFTHTITMRFSPGTCTPLIFKSDVESDEMDALEAELDSDVTSGHFTMQIYDDSSGGFEGVLLIKRGGTFADDNSGATTILFSTNIDGTTITGPREGPFVWTGPVEVQASGVGRSGAWGYRAIQCSGMTPYMVTATINR